MKGKRCGIYIIGILILWSLTGVFSVHAAEANWLWPLENHGQECIPSGGRFGDPRDGGARKHSGLDLSVQIGTPVRAMKSGWIVPKPKNVYRGYWMVIDHQDGSYTDYQHLNSYAIQSQRMVAQGEIIGYTGKSGSGNGPHLHFEIRTGARDQANNYDRLTAHDPLGVSYIYSVNGNANSENPDDYQQVAQDLYLTSPVMTGSQVGYVQAVLRYLGYNISIDLSYGPATRDAVRQFQQDHGLSADGSCGPQTRAKLIEVYQAKKNQNNHETNPPVISDVRVTDLTATGYTVSCKVTDESGVNRVQFPTWTGANGQDDIQADWGNNSAASGSRSGDTFTYRVEDSDHNYERGIYATHIYAYDNYGNYGYNGTVEVNLQNTYKPSASVNYKGYTYQVYDDLLSWAGARDKCRAMGGQLASVPTEEIMKVLRDLAGKGKRQAFYAGGTDEAQEGQFKWMDGTAFTYTNWSPGQPDNAYGNENYLEFYKDGSWNDGQGKKERFGFILQKVYKPADQSGNSQKPGTNSSTDKKKPSADTKKNKIPGKPVIIKANRKKKNKMTMKISKVKGALGYQIQYALNTKFTKGRKQVVTKKLTNTFAGLRKKKAYYVRARAYSLNEKGKKVFGKFSKTRKIPA